MTAMNPAVDLKKPIPAARQMRQLLLAAALLAAAWSGGCAAVSNPVADAVPVHRLPPEILGKRKDEEKTIDLQLLRQPQPVVYRLAPGDVLGVFIENVLGEPKQAPPVNLPEVGSNVPPSTGFPIPVREDGTIALPFIDPIKVEGRSLAEVQAEIVKAYVAKQILTVKDGVLQSRVLVSLIKQRQYHVLVVRQDSGGLTVGATGSLGQTKRGTGYVLNLPAYENDVLNALARTGGMPGLDAQNEVVIERGSMRDFDNKDAVMQHINQGSAGRIVRIPLRLRLDDPIPFKPEDVVLQNGDIVYIEARDTELFYTGGLLPPRQFVLPRDYDLDVVQAVALVAGPLINGNINQSNLSGNIVQSGIGFPSPSLITILRRTPGGGQIPIRVSLNDALRDPRQRVLIQPGDWIILQETLEETITRYFTEQFHLNFLGTIIRQNDLIGTATLNLPKLHTAACGLAIQTCQSASGVSRHHHGSHHRRRAAGSGGASRSGRPCTTAAPLLPQVRSATAAPAHLQMRSCAAAISGRRRRGEWPSDPMR
jgi:protein involved in polysaccharide export with SLBB domain